MSCQTVRKSISEYLDQRLGGQERTRVAQHLAACRECAAHLAELSDARSVLMTLPFEPVPERLKVQLQVVASRERSRWNSIRTWPLTWQTCMLSLRLAVDNMMRPLALPLAGGILSALFLFGLLMPTFGYKPTLRDDVPLPLYTSATLVDVPIFGVSNGETVVTLYVDGRGQAMDYAVQSGKLSPELQSELARMMVLSRFSPATLFGQPTNGKVTLSFRRVNYVVHG